MKKLLILTTLLCAVVFFSVSLMSLWSHNAWENIITETHQRRRVWLSGGGL